MLTIEQLEDYLESIEELLSSSLSAATTDLPNVRDAVNRLWVDISRYGPGMPSFPEVHLPRLSDFEVPPPPPPPPKTWVDKSVEWATDNPWAVTGIVVGSLGAGLLVGYGATRGIRSKKVKTRSQPMINERRKVVVVLGGDTSPLGLALVIALEKSGFVVITSVATPEAVEYVEAQSQGYVRALVLNPVEPASVPVFMRSLSSTLSRRFPLNAAGDPHVSPAAQAYIYSVVSLLTLPTSTIHAPLEHISMRNDYLPYLSATHITPLSVIQSILPMLRSNPARARDSISNDRGARSIIVCLPAADARVGLLFSSAQAMSAAATLRGVEVLRREISVASLTDRTESMKHLKVVLIDVGTFGTASLPIGNMQAMEGWTASEKLAYGPAFASISNPEPTASVTTWNRVFTDNYQYGVPRKPTDVSAFVNTVLGIVDGDRRKSLPIFRFGLGMLRNWFRGERLSVGAGATTYKLASFLPSAILDTLLNIPHFLISVRNALLPTQPFIEPSTVPLTPAPKHTPPAPHTELAAESGTDYDSLSGNEAMVSKAGSEADVESNSGESSWIRLNPDCHQ